MKVRNIRPSQGGFTPIELLIAMALIVLLMTIISQAFSAGVRAFDDLEAIGDLDEKLDDDCVALADRITATNQRASDFIQNSLRTGTVTLTRQTRCANSIKRSVTRHWNLRFDCEKSKAGSKTLARNVCCNVR